MIKAGDAGVGGPGLRLGCSRFPHPPVQPLQQQNNAGQWERKGFWHIGLGDLGVESQ